MDANGWRPIETAVKDVNEEIILVYHIVKLKIESAFFESEVGGVSSAWWCEHQKEWICPNGTLGRVTHWQPLPLPPPPAQEGK